MTPRASVIPAQAGISRNQQGVRARHREIPAFAGVAWTTP